MKQWEYARNVGQILGYKVVNYQDDMMDGKVLYGPDGKLCQDVLPALRESWLWKQVVNKGLLKKWLEELSGD